jgi:hypothetical protein
LRYDVRRQRPAFVCPHIERRLEIGLSYDRLLQDTRENFYGARVWWEPKDTGFRLRSEFARGHHAQGYWIEADYRTQAFGGLDSFVGRFEPIFRMEQTFRRDAVVSDGLPLVNTQRASFGWTTTCRTIPEYSRAMRGSFLPRATAMSGRPALFTGS